MNYICLSKATHGLWYKGQLRAISSQLFWDCDIHSSWIALNILFPWWNLFPYSWGKLSVQKLIFRVGRLSRRMTLTLAWLVGVSETDCCICGLERVLALALCFPCRLLSPNGPSIPFLQQKLRLYNGIYMSMSCRGNQTLEVIAPPPYSGFWIS